MTSIRAEIKTELSTPAHEYVTVWAGPDAEHRAYTGILNMRTDEAADLVARIEAREPAACPVASEPVELPAELARELANKRVGRSIGNWTVVANDYVESSRWASLHWLVIHNEAGQHFAETYRRGLTEEQETRPFDDGTTATFTPVAPQHKVVTEWKTTPRGGRS